MGLVRPRSFQLQNARGKRVIINHGTIRFFSRLSKNSSHRHKPNSTGTNKVTAISGRRFVNRGGTQKCDAESCLMQFSSDFDTSHLRHIPDTTGRRGLTFVEPVRPFRPRRMCRVLTSILFLFPS